MRWNNRKGKISPKQLENLKKIHLKYGKKVICLDTGVVYDSVGKAAKDRGFSAAGISMVCKGEYSHTHGTHWAYYDEYQQKQGQM